MTDSVLSIIVGEQLSSVEFIQDYLQLRFDGPCLTTFVWPVIKEGENLFKFGNSGYRDALCNLISRRVSKASVSEGDKIVLQFGSDNAILVSLKPQDRQTVEAATFSYNDVRPHLAVW